MSKILCLETATSICSVALFEGGELISSKDIEENFRHSELLTVLIRQVLDDAGLETKDLSAVAVSNGPGSYTGLRIGMSVAKGICFANDLPLISVSTLELMSARAIAQLKNERGLVFCPMIDARRMEVYCALYDENLNMIKPPAAVIVDENFFKDVENKIMFFGDGAEKCKNILNNKFTYASNVFPSAKSMGKLAFNKYISSQFEDVSLAEPVYLKEFVVGPKKV